jgi:hypothetical protein
MSPYQAVVESAVSRRKPVLKAAATTVFAFVPLLLDTFWESVAVTIMFGLAFATISSHGGGTGALCDPVSHSSAEICLRTCFMNWMSSSESGTSDPFPRDCPTALRANGPHPFTFLSRGGSLRSWPAISLPHPGLTRRSSSGEKMRRRGGLDLRARRCSSLGPDGLTEPSR